MGWVPVERGGGQERGRDPPWVSKSFVVRCGGKTSLEGNNSSSICDVTFLVYFLTMASQFDPQRLSRKKKKKEKGFSHVQEPVKQR